MSWKPEVIADAGGTWAGNALRFATEDEAKIYVADLKERWMNVTDTRVVTSDDPVNHAIIKNAGQYALVTIELEH